MERTRRERAPGARCYRHPVIERIPPKMRLVLATLFACSLAVAACGGAPAAPATPSGTPGAAAAQAIVPAGEAKIGDRTKCPVSGKEFVVTAESPKVEYKGKTYYTCCGDCQQDFQKDPEKYLKKPSAPAT
jgi:YHS domain-containing protein